MSFILLKDKGKTIKRISIFGPPGSDKTTLAFFIHNNFDYPLIRMDDINYSFFKQKNRLPNDTEFLRELMYLLEMEKWVSDGFYRLSIASRLEMSDLIIFHDYHYLISFKNIFIRSVLNFFGISTTTHIENRDSFVSKLKYFLNPGIYIRVINFKNNYRGAFLNALKSVGGNKVIIVHNNRREVLSFFSSLKENNK